MVKINVIIQIAMVVGFFALSANSQTSEFDNFGKNDEYLLLQKAFEKERRNDAESETRGMNEVFQQSAKLFAADPTPFNQFGRSVSISGNTAIVSSFKDYVNGNAFQGSAYIFVKTESGWVQQQKIFAEDGTEIDYFGISVAIYANTAVVGAYTHEIGTNNGQGAAYVFIRNGSTWTLQQKLIASDGQASDNFGISVAISLDTIIIGAAGDDILTNPDQGSAYIFVRNGNVWHQQQKITVDNGAAGDSFGVNVSITGNTAIVGAGLDDVNGNSNQGSAYTFVRNGSSWVQQQQLIAPDGASDDIFGGRVGIFGETAVIGAYSDDIGANGNQGSAYIYQRDGGVWSFQQKLTANDGAAEDNFGIAVTITGNTVAVGSFVDDVGKNEDQGSVYIFRRSGNIWPQEKVTSSDGTIGDWFGSSVALSMNQLIVGAELVDFNPTLEPGAAYIFQDPNLLQKIVIKGRIFRNTEQGAINSFVSLVKENGETIYTRTNSFGYYRFNDIEVGQTVKIEVRSKQFNYSPQIIGIANNINDLNFLPN